MFAAKHRKTAAVVLAVTVMVINIKIYTLCLPLFRLYLYFSNITTVSTCLEEINKMPFEPGGALAEGYFSFISC